MRRVWGARPQLTQRGKMDILLANVGPAVRDELAWRADASQDPEAALKIIGKIYGEKRSPAQLLQNLYHQIQLPGETIREFSNKVNSAYRALTSRQQTLGERPYPPKIAQDHFVNSLRDKTLTSWIAEKVHAEPHLSFLDIREACIRWSREEAAGAVVAAQHIPAPYSPHAPSILTHPHSSPPSTVPSAYTAAQQIIPQHPQPRAPHFPALPPPPQPPSAVEGLLKQLIERMDTFMSKPQPNPTIPQPNPANPAPKPQPLMKQRPQVTCYYCNREGHMARECRKKARDQAQGNGQPR